MVRPREGGQDVVDACQTAIFIGGVQIVFFLNVPNHQATGNFQSDLTEDKNVCKWLFET